MKWHELWKARFGEALDRAQIDVWEEELETEISRLTPNEIVSAIRAIGEQKRKGEIKYKPTLNHLISAIIRERYAERNHGSAIEAQTSTQERINRTRHNIRRHIQNGNITEAWTIICHHEPDNEIRELEIWAEENCGFERPTFEQMGLKPLTQIWREFALHDGMRRVTDDIKTPIEAEY